MNNKIEKVSIYLYIYQIIFLSAWLGNILLPFGFRSAETCLTLIYICGYL